MHAPRWHSAIAFASRAHAGQTRRDGETPYAAHVCRVALIIAVEFGCDDEVVLSAAALHDTIEDTPADFDEVADAFGDGVARLVAAMTKDMAKPREEREALYESAINAGDWRVKLIKLADALDNLRDRSSAGVGADRARRAVDGARRAVELAGADARAGDEPLRTAIRVVRAAANDASFAGGGRAAGGGTP